MDRHEQEDTKETISEQMRVAIMEVLGEHVALGIQGRDLDDAMLWEIRNVSIGTKPEGLGI